jgi:peptide/nickel transport system permease protein
MTRLLAAPAAGGAKSLGASGTDDGERRAQSRIPTISPAILKYFLRRFLTIPLTLLIATASLYALLLLAPPEERALLYMPDNLSPRVTEEDIARMIQLIIETRHLDDPFPVQYAMWLSGLVQGDWGFSPLTQQPVLPALLARVPITAELAIYSILAFIPLGLLAGVFAARRSRSPADNAFRAAAFVATSLPPFILGLMLLAVFYVGLGWFSPLRLGIDNSMFVNSSQFRTVTGLLTIDGLLNGRPDITLDALRHLVLPVITLGLSHWATLGRLTRAGVLDELHRVYITSARARGLPPRLVVWRHALRNALIPSLNSTALSAASLVTGVFVVESVFGLHGMSELITNSLTSTPDLFMAIGFAVFSILLVLPLMFILDVIQAVLDPRVREGIIGE